MVGVEASSSPGVPPPRRIASNNFLSQLFQYFFHSLFKALCFRRTLPTDLASDDASPPAADIRVDAAAKVRPLLINLEGSERAWGCSVV
jgi:hypothetical protein